MLILLCSLLYILHPQLNPTSYLFSVFLYVFYLYFPFGAASKQISLYCVKSYVRFIVCAVTRKRMLGNVIQHDDQRQIALLCKNMNEIPFVSANIRATEAI